MMPRSPSQDENGLKKGPWTPEEDRKLVDYIEKHGHGSWRALPKLAGLNRCGKSCRLRWTNYLRPDIKRGKFSDEEEQIIINLHAALGNKWSMIASHLPGRTDNEIKNFWNTHLKKKLLQMGIDPVTHMPRTDHLNIFSDLQQLLSATNLSNMTRSSWDNSISWLQSEATQLAKIQLLQNILQLLSCSSGASGSNVEAIYSLFGTQPCSELEGFANPSIQIHSNFPNAESSQQPLVCDDYQTAAMEGLKSCRAFENDNDRVGTFYDMNPSSYTLPNLVPVSPGCSNKFNQIIESKNGEKFSNPLSKSAAFEDNWEDLMDDEATDSYWRDVINQTPPQAWKIS